MPSPIPAPADYTVYACIGGTGLAACHKRTGHSFRIDEDDAARIADANKAGG